MVSDRGGFYVQPSQDETSGLMFAWALIVLLFLCLTYTLIENEDEVAALKAHIHLLTQACEGK
jgi:hypothetical protein